MTAHPLPSFLRLVVAPALNSSFIYSVARQLPYLSSIKSDAGRITGKETVGLLSTEELESPALFTLEMEVSGLPEKEWRMDSIFNSKESIFFTLVLCAFLFLFLFSCYIPLLVDVFYVGNMTACKIYEIRNKINCIGYLKTLLWNDWTMHETKCVTAWQGKIWKFWTFITCHELHTSIK